MKFFHYLHIAIVVKLWICFIMIEGLAGIKVQVIFWPKTPACVNIKAQIIFMVYRLTGFLVRNVIFTYMYFTP